MKEEELRSAALRTFKEGNFKQYLEGFKDGFNFKEPIDPNCYESPAYAAEDLLAVSGQLKELKALVDRAWSRAVLTGKDIVYEKPLYKVVYDSGKEVKDE